MTHPEPIAAEREATIAALRLEQRIRKARSCLRTWCEVMGPTELGPWRYHRWQDHAVSELQKLSDSLIAIEEAYARGECTEQIRATLETLTQVGKTEVVVRFISWHMARACQSVAVGAYSDPLAREISGKIRSILRSAIAAKVFPHLRRAKDDALDDVDEFGQRLKDSEAEWSIPHRDPTRRNVRMFGRGRRGGLNGRMVWLVVTDDLLKGMSAYLSHAERDECDHFIRSEALPRIIERGGALLMVGSRYGDDDPQGRLVASSKRGGAPVKVLRYPLRAPEGSPDGRAPGEYITAGWTPEKEAQTRAEYGRRLARAILDCDPEQDGGGKWTRADFSRRYQGDPWAIRATCSRTWLALDGAETAGGGDWSVIAWWGFRGGRYIKLWQWRQQVEYPELRELLRDCITRCKPNATYIEKKSSGKAVYQELSRSLPVIGVDVTRSKGDRYNAASPSMQHLCDYPEADVAPWMPEYVDRMVAVTGHGDEVDDEADADTLGLLAELEGVARAAPDPRSASRALAAFGARR